MYIRLLFLNLLLILSYQANSQKLVVGITENTPLKSYDTLRLEANGFFIDLLDYIAAKEGWQLEYKPFSFQECLQALENGEIDIMPDLGYSKYRSQQYQFNTVEVMLAWGQVYTTKGSKIKTLLDLNQKKIAIVKNDLFFHNPNDGFLLIANNFDLKCQYIYAENYHEVLKLIENGDVDAGIVNRIFGDYNSHAYDVAKTSIIFSPVQLRYAFPKDEKYENIISKLDHHLMQLKANNNSIYYSLIEKHFYVKEVNVIPRGYRVFVIAVIVLLFITLLFVFILRFTVKKRTLDLNKALIKAKESDQLKSVFLRNLSHEIRTPMNGINGFSLLLKDENLDNSIRNRYIDLVISSSEQLLSIVDNILSVSLIETRQEKVKLSKVNLNEILDDLYLIFSKSLDEKGVQFSLEKGLKDDDVTLNTDRTKFRQILSNLLGNAVKFTYEGHIKYGYSLKGNMLEFFIEDTGIGIDIKLKDQIFKMFSQEDNSSKRKYEGAGLGLSIAKGYVELLGGEIYFYSEKGKGTTFYFTIPYNA